MTIKQFFQHNSFWGLVTVGSFIVAIVFMLCMLAVLLFDPNANLDLIIKISKWAIPALLALFAFSSAVRIKEVKVSLENARQKEERQQEMEMLNKRMELLEKEKELLEKKIKLHDEMIEIRNIERERMSKPYEE